MRKRTMTILTATMLAFAAPAYAYMSGESVTEKLNSDEEGSFILGAADMYMFYHHDQATCVIDWLKEGDGYKKIHAVLKRFPDKPAVATVKVMLERQCGPEKKG